MFLRVWVKIELNWIDWNCVTWYFRSCNVRNTFVYLTTYQSNTMFLILGNCLTLLLLPSALVCWVSWMQSWLKTKYFSDKRYHYRIAVTNILEVTFDSWFYMKGRNIPEISLLGFLRGGNAAFHVSTRCLFFIFLFGCVRCFLFEQTLANLPLAS